MKDNHYEQLVKRWKETVDLPTQHIGPFTPLYKSVTKRLKVMPWIVFVISAAIVVLCLYYLLGPSITSWVSLLQRGF